MKAREEYETQVKELNNQETIPLWSLTEIKIELLLDIRDLLFEIKKNQGIDRWGPKIDVK